MPAMKWSVLLVFCGFDFLALFLARFPTDSSTEQLMPGPKTEKLPVFFSDSVAHLQVMLATPLTDQVKVVETHGARVRCYSHSDIFRIFLSSRIWAIL